MKELGGSFLGHSPSYSLVLPNGGPKSRTSSKNRVLGTLRAWRRKKEDILVAHKDIEQTEWACGGDFSQFPVSNLGIYASPVGPGIPDLLPLT